jgi:hypothetical protein
MCDSSLKSSHLGEEILATIDPKSLNLCKDVFIFYFFPHDTSKHLQDITLKNDTPKISTFQKMA